MSARFFPKKYTLYLKVDTSSIFVSHSNPSLFVLLFPFLHVQLVSTDVQLMPTDVQLMPIEVQLVSTDVQLVSTDVQLMPTDDVQLMFN